MFSKKIVSFLFFFLVLGGLHSSEKPLFESVGMKGLPVAYQGRYREIHAYADLWLYDIYQSVSVKTKDKKTLQASTPIDLLWKFHFFGHQPYDSTPLFWVNRSDVKKILSLDPHRHRFSYNELIKPVQQLAPIINETPAADGARKEVHSLLASLRKYQLYRGSALLAEQNLNSSVSLWMAEGKKNSEISRLIEKHYPERARLLQAGETFNMLPSKRFEGEWYSLHALQLQSFDPQTHKFVPISNFTSLPSPLFEELRKTYLSLQVAIYGKEEEKSQQLADDLGRLLHEGYAAIQKMPSQRGALKALYYPSQARLLAEAFYYQYPLIEVALFCYGAALCGLCFSLGPYRQSPPSWRSAETLSIIFMGIGFLIHTLIILLRTYILQRPPVSNMFETAIYVPWIAVFLSFMLKISLKTNLLLISSNLVAILLLVILKITNVNSSLENVQAVLDSQYWLIIHVLMIVGSYGVLILSGILAHVYIFGYLWNGKEAPWLLNAACSMKQCLYIGIALLVPGTILGGIWAAQSWGRFWDWDPKESWAFISSCVYVISVHAHYFRHIHHFGLAIGAVVGLMAISFTWYGVNYILGSGLHSYGFGSGGELIYYSYLFAESCFLITALLFNKKLLQKNKKFGY